MANDPSQARHDVRAVHDERADEVRDLLSRIDAAVCNRDPRWRRQPAPPTWADVGDLGHVRDRLRDVARFLRADEDEPGQR